MNWKTTKADLDLIDKIVKRVTDMHAYPTANPRAKPRSSFTAQQQQTLRMDLQAAHANGCPLDLAGLLAATPYEFTHDTGGITGHIDRNTGELLHCFVPRYAMRYKQNSGSAG